MADLYKIIDELLKEKGVSGSKMSSDLGMSRSFMTELRKGRAKSIKTETAKKIADYFGVSTDYLLGYVSEPYFYLDDARILAELNSYDNEAKKTPTPSNILPMPETKKLPRLGTIACGEPILAEENIEDWDSVPLWVRADFTLKCKGDSMINARIFDGDVVCIHKQEAVDDGEIAAVLIGDEATLKRVHLFADHIVLQPENPNYRPLSYWEEEMNDVHILGKATYFISAVR